MIDLSFGRRSGIGLQRLKEAVLTFAFTRMVDVAITLAGIAAGTILARDGVLALLERRGGSIGRVSRALSQVRY